MAVLCSEQTGKGCKEGALELPSTVSGHNDWATTARNPSFNEGASNRIGGDVGVIPATASMGGLCLAKFCKSRITT